MVYIAKGYGGGLIEGRVRDKCGPLFSRNTLPTEEHGVSMRCYLSKRLPVLVIASTLTLTGCNPLAIASAVGLGKSLLAPSGPGAAGAMPQPAPIGEQLSDVTSAVVDEACRAQLPAKAENETPKPAGNKGNKACGYRDVCLPGHARPKRLMVCEILSVEDKALQQSVAGDISPDQAAAMDGDNAAAWDWRRAEDR